MEQLTLALVAPVSLADLPPFAAGKVTIAPESGCWRGTGLAHDRDGYARVGGEGAHRRVWREVVGEIGDGLVIDHVADLGCRWRDCLLVDHLEPVSALENWLRGQSMTRLNSLKTECGVCGTPYDKANTYHYKNRRECRCCNRAAVARYTKRQRQRALSALAAAA